MKTYISLFVAMLGHITALIPYVPIDQACIDMTSECVRAITPHVDRVILIENGYNPEVNSEELFAYCDILIKKKRNNFQAGALNAGYGIAISYSDCEYIACIDNGVIFPEKGDFHALCTPGVVVSPKIANQEQEKGFHGSFLVCDRDTFAEIGLWDTNKQMAADEEWFQRAISQGVECRGEFSVQVGHPQVGITKLKMEQTNIQYE